MKLIGQTLIYGAAIMLSAYLYPGVRVSSFSTALLAALLLMLASVSIKPIMIFLTLPITVLTLGLFLVVINAIILLLVSALLKGFSIDGFWHALVFGIILYFVHAALQWFSQAIF